MAFSSLVFNVRKTFSSIAFTVRRRKPKLIVPFKPTPHEFKYLSDIDDRKGNHPFVASTCNREDIVDVIRKALADTLVFYYLFAGRLREAPRGKLLVECTGQSVIFVEADADVSLNQLGGDDLKPPFPFIEQLLYAPVDSEEILCCHLMLIQVTRLTCGRFTFGISHNHTISLAEIARGHLSPSILPVWERHLLNAREPPQVSFHSFFFGPKESASLRQQVPHYLQVCTTFELLTAWLWRCRTIAIGYDPKEEVRVVIAVTARGKFHTPLPIGFYGNAIADPLVKKVKNDVNEVYIRSTADLMATKGRPVISTERTYFVSDLRRVLNGDEVDFGCGIVVQVFSGTAISIPTLTSWMSNVYISYRNKGDRGILVPVSLRRLAMKKFVIEIESTYNN
ncbi:hypothetical protein MKX01_001622 [Papaver californicum]|nr:hypothetical protein MKX01_001622 [Papaver californicum]